jgi:hypothetical protein
LWQNNLIFVALRFARFLGSTVTMVVATFLPERAAHRTDVAEQTLGHGAVKVFRDRGSGACSKNPAMFF